MSKLDALRAMREARYKQEQERAGRPSARARPAVAPPAPGETPAPPAAKAGKTTPARAAKARKPAAAASPADDQPQEELCGHRNMSGRTCTRERGHAAKSHRYS